MSLLPWHDDLARDVARRLEAGTLPHALLVTGPPGWGERDFANWMALRLIDADTDREAAALAHPDLRWVVPDGAVIKVDAVREIVAFAQGTPQSGPRKVAVLAGAEALNTSAANALLKTLEEPPPGTHLLLVSSQPGRLLPTIRSRCQRLEIRPDHQAARDWLADRVAADVLDLRLFEHGGAPVAVAAAEAGGQPLLAGLLELALDPARDGEVVAGLLDSGLPDALGRWYRYVAAMAAGHRPLARPDPAPARALMGFADELVWVRRQLLSSNSANDRLLAERLLVCWRRVESARP